MYEKKIHLVTIIVLFALFAAAVPGAEERPGLSRSARRPTAGAHGSMS